MHGDFGVSDVLSCLRKVCYNNKPRHYLPRYVWLNLQKLDSPGFHMGVLEMLDQAAQVHSSTLKQSALFLIRVQGPQIPLRTIPPMALLTNL